MGINIALVVLVILVVYFIAIYNSLVRYRVEVDNSWSQIDVQLKRRHDLIPNLVETVKGVMDFEKQTLTQVMQARVAAMGSSNPNDRLKAENEITSGLSHLMAVWENYPVLKSNENAKQLQEELTSTENKIAYVRGHYNDIVSNFNSMTRQFPSNLIAGPFGFVPREFLKAADAEKEVPQVKF
ncbi:MAG TPA: LemA family protein [bacterium]|jgi:LemA protein|nr:LemA family protein [bacterium]